MKQITISITFDSNKQASIIASSLKPEVIDTIPHTLISIITEENILNLTIKAEQTNTLRAACNSYLRWIQTALSINEIV
jgi:tRNA threonylcarbamoyladenosine modification (KEOPS) complex  Pcc1 subunit